MNDMGTLFGPWRFTWTEADAVRWAAIAGEGMVEVMVCYGGRPFEELRNCFDCDGTGRLS